MSCLCALAEVIVFVGKVYFMYTRITTFTHTNTQELPPTEGFREFTLEDAGVAATLADGAGADTLGTGAAALLFEGAGAGAGVGAATGTGAAIAPASSMAPRSSDLEALLSPLVLNSSASSASLLPTVTSPGAASVLV